jgi:hypothetical protein
MLRCIVCALAILLLSACATTIKDLSAYRPAPLLEADFMPSREMLTSRRAQVVVFEAENSAAQQRAPQLGTVLTRAIEARLSESGAEIVDRDVALTLRDELTLAEAKGQGSYAGPAVANFAVKTTLTNANFSSEYVQLQLVRTKKGTYWEPAHCNYRAQVSASLRVYEIPSLRLLGNANLVGPAYLSSEERCNDSRADALLRQAAEEAVKRNRTEFQNLFAPKGYVIEKRVSGSKAIFKIMLGSTQGIKSQDKLAFFSLQQNVNPLTQQTSFEEVQLVEGVVSDQISPDFCWVVPLDQTRASKIRLGDFVKVVYRKSALESVGESFSDIGGARILDKALRFW